MAARNGSSESRKKDFEQAVAEITRRAQARFEAIWTPSPITGYAGFLSDWEVPIVIALADLYGQLYRLAGANRELIEGSPQAWTRKRIRPFIADNEDRLAATFWNHGNNDLASAFGTRLAAAFDAKKRDLAIERASALPRPLGRTASSAPNSHEKAILAAIREGKHGLQYCQRLDLDTEPPRTWSGRARTYQNIYRDKRLRKKIWKERSRVERRWLRG